MMLAEAVDATREGPLAAFKMSDRDRYELKMAGLLHDLPPKIFCPPYPLGQWNNESTVAGF
jgi:hypothetical protein